jgi:hypothetical protein
MGCSPMQFNSDNAISEIVSISLVLMIVTGALSAILFWGVPYMQEKKSYIAIESALFQLDVLGEMIDDALNYGLNTSKIMNLKVDSGELLFKSQGSRFIIYFPIHNFGYDEGEYLQNMFEFDIQDFEDDDTNFEISINGPRNEAQMNIRLIITDLLNQNSEIINRNNIPIDGSFNLFSTNTISLNDAIKIEIIRTDPTDEEYGRIYLFDSGSLEYEKASEIGIHRVIIQNDCILSARDSVGNLFYHEPRTWSQTLLDGTNLISLRFIRFILDEDYNIDAIGGNAAIDADIIITANESNSPEKRVPVFGDLRMKIFGDEAVVPMWRYYYINNMNFNYNEVLDLLYMDLDELIPQDYWDYGGDIMYIPSLTLTYSVCKIGLEANQ